MFFGLWQLKDLTTPYSWNYANLAVSVLSWILCIFITLWTIYLSLKFNKNPDSTPKKYKFIQGEDSHLHY